MRDWECLTYKKEDSDGIHTHTHTHTYTHLFLNVWRVVE